MAENTGIEWADATFNAWIGCASVSPGCDNCYAESMANRRGWHDWQNDTPRHVTSDAYWRQPHRWNRAAEAEGRRWRVFCGSLMDVFDPQAPREVRERLWDLIEATPWLDWLLLTKRPQLIKTFLPDRYGDNGLPANVWLGFSAEDQEHFDRRWKHVAALGATVKFVSYEPALGSLTLRGPVLGRHVLPDWVICGGESGHGARPMDPDWARAVRDQCEEWGIPLFFKQWGQIGNNPLEQELGSLEAQLRDPKSNGKGGALLDDVLHREFPSVGTAGE